MSIAYNSSIILDGLVLCIDAANPKSYPGSGTAWYDISGQQQHGTIVNAPTYTANNGGTFNFVSASNNYVTFPTTVQANSIVKPAQLTCGIFIYKSSWTASADRIFSTTEAGSYSLTTDTAASQLSWNVRYGAGYAVLNYPLASLSPGWNYFAATADQQYAKLYVNGNVANTYDYGSNIGITHSATHLVLGAEPGGGTNIDPTFTKLTGQVAALHIYNKVLTDGEIKQNFNAYRGRFGI